MPICRRLRKCRRATDGRVSGKVWPGSLARNLSPERTDMNSSHTKRGTVGLAFALGLTLAGSHSALAQAEPANPAHTKELYFDAARAGRVDLLEGLIKAGMNPDERDRHGY